MGQSNRRNNGRFVPMEDRAWLGWWDGPTFRAVEAVLLNISKGGVLVQAETPPPRRSVVWICLEGPRRTEWVEGKTLEVGKERIASSTSEIRIMFDDICPYAFFEVAVFGWQAALTAPIISPCRDAEFAASVTETTSGLAMMSY